MGTLMAAFRTLWVALVGLYEETLVLLGGNLAATALNLPLGLALFLLATLAATVFGLPLGGSSDDSGGGGAQWLLVLIAWLLPFLPTPGNVGLAGLTRVAAGPDAPRFVQFRASLRTHWRLAVVATLVSLAVTLALAGNVFFYAVLATDWLRLVSILWLYALLFWLSLHVYLVPLLVHVTEPRLVDLYRRAAFVALGHPAYTFVLLFALLAFALLSVVFVPVYVLIGGAFISLVQAHALREIRRRHGDLLIEPEEEVSRL
jgi:uncharacterized membrane protein YesL